MELVIAEKPSVARDLARVLGVHASRDEWWESDRYAITWCIGHLVELEEPAAYDAAWKPWRLDRLPMLPSEFLLRPAEHARKQLRVVEKLLRDRRFSAAINACDAGREGELIFRYVYQHARSRLPVRRLWISSLTDDAIRRGFAQLRPGRDYDALADAARSRSEADWLVGMNATRAITVHSRSLHALHPGGDTLFSIGRVQTPTLALLVAREREIRTFVPTPYWEVRGEFRTADGATFQTLYRDGKVSRFATAQLADTIVARDADHASAADPEGPRVVALRARTVKEPAPQLFDLTSLQRTANRRFGFSAQRTLELAQALYERHKIVTYPRTDSRHLSSDVAKELPPLFAALAKHDAETARFAQQLVERPPRPTSRIVDDRKVHDHHAIIPTGTPPRGSLDRDEARLYDLIVRRFLGAFFPDAELAVTEAWIRVGAGNAPPPELGPGDRETIAKDLPAPPDHYFARGRVRVVAGWQEVAGIDAATAARGSERPRTDGRQDDDREDESSALPPLAMGQRLAGRFAPVARETKPPPRYSEATLLAAMEGAGKSLDDEALRAAMKDVGLGTPATRASIIETLLRRKYIARERGHLIATPTGIGLVGAIPVPSLASPELTGQWEARLARIARGEDSRDAFMGDIAQYVRDLIDKIRGSSIPFAPSTGGSPSVGGAPEPSRPSPSAGSWNSRAPGRRAPSARKSKARNQRASAFRGDASTNTSNARGQRASAFHEDASTSNARGQRASGFHSSASTAKTSKTRGRRGSSFEPASQANAPSLVRSAESAPSVRSRSAATSSTTSGAKTARARKSRENAPLPLGSLLCPRCKQGHLMTGSRGWGCDRWKQGCTFVVWFETAGTKLTVAQLKALVTKGKTAKAMFDDATGTPVMARLVLDPSVAGGARVVPV
ncbi:MAG: hypothetical protein HOV81_35080 [Kofleriaceae bacterium]|nr:hypothetical protein [Kofleriaceae bacterium]